MPVLIYGDKIRLNGKEAKDYLEETGKSKLPITTAEYNKALQDSIEYWLKTNCPEGQLLAALITDKLLNVES